MHSKIYKMSLMFVLVAMLSLMGKAQLKTVNDTSEAPQLISATSGNQLVDLVWEPIESDLTEGDYWPDVSGNASDLVWTIYILEATFNGVDLSAGDEIAIFDGDKLVGSMVLPGTPPGTPDPDFALKAWETLDDGPGFMPGNPFTVKCWHESSNIESTSFWLSRECVSRR